MLVYNEDMAQKPLIISLITLCLIIGGMLYLRSNDQKDSKKPTAGSIEQTSTPVAPTTGSGMYVDYSESVITSTNDMNTKLLFFHAPWCPQCRALEADIKQRGVPDGITIIKVDYDTNQTLRQKYGVTLQTTIVKIDKIGELIDKFVAYDDPSLNAVVENL